MPGTLHLLFSLIGLIVLIIASSVTGWVYSRRCAQAILEHGRRLSADELMDLLEQLNRESPQIFFAGRNGVALALNGTIVFVIDGDSGYLASSAMRVSFRTKRRMLAICENTDFEGIASQTPAFRTLYCGCGLSVFSVDPPKLLKRIRSQPLT